MAVPSGFPEGLCPKCLLTGGTPAEPPLPDDEVADIDRTLFVEAPTPSQLSRPAGIPSVEVLRRLFPDLEILDLLGAGGMGAVYKARQPRLNRLVALKIMVCPPGHAADFALRFEREAQVLARLNHPHIVTIHDFGDLPPERTGDDPLFYFLMEYVDGTDLGQLIKSKELKPAQALAIVPQICEALQYAHDQGITHRDVKPANILLDQNGTVKIADFGLAKMGGGSMEEAMMTGLTQTGTAMGTPHYMAPEQWEHPETVDHRADIYALGVVFYEMLTGERPAGVFEPPSKCSPVDKKLDGVVMRAMEKNPDRRYQKASEIGDDVTRISGANPRAGKAPVEKRGRSLMPLFALAAVAMLGIGGWALWPEEDEKADGSARPPATAAPQATFTFGSSRYALVNEGHTWPEARKLAEASGGRLAVFETEAEESAVREHVRPYLESQMYWIGGFAEEGSRNIRWLNDQPVGSASWARGHPGWRTDAASPEVQTLGRQLCAVGVSIIKNKEEPGRWIHVTSQGRNHPGYLIEWDDAASAPPSPVAGGPSTLPSHEWVKVDWVGHNTWRDSEICRLVTAKELARDGGLKLSNIELWMSDRVPGFSKLQNGGIRLRWKSTVDTPERIANLMVSPRGNFKCSVNVSLKNGATVQYGGHGDEFKLGNIPHGGLPPLGEEMEVEIACVGRMLILKQGGVLQGTLELPDTSPPSYPQFRGNNVVVTEASVINLDGLSEAEALKVLGVPISPPPADWIDVDFAGADPASFAKGAIQEGRQLRLQHGVWFPTPDKTFQNVAQRVTLTWRADTENLNLLFGPAASERSKYALNKHYAKINTTNFGNRYCEIGHLTTTATSLTGSAKPVDPPINPGDQVVLIFATIGDDHYVSLNGKLQHSVQSPLPASPAGYETVVSAYEALLDKYEYLPLDGLSKEEALNLLGLPTPPPPAKSAVGKGRLTGTGTMYDGKPVDLSKTAAYDDFVDVFVNNAYWVALRANGETISSHGMADHKDIRKIGRRFGGDPCFIDAAGKIHFLEGREEMELPAALQDGVVVDAVCGNDHGVALLENGEAVVFGRRYEEAMDDSSGAIGTATPRWPLPPPAALQKVKALAALKTHAATLHDDGTVSVWGWEGAVAWEPEPEMKPVLQIASAMDALRMLDADGQVWTFPLPRSTHPDQPVGFNGKLLRLDKEAVRLRDQVWQRKDGTWSGDKIDSRTMELLQSGQLEANAVFALVASTGPAGPFGYLLRVEPADAASTSR